MEGRKGTVQVLVHGATYTRGCEFYSSLLFFNFLLVWQYPRLGDEQVVANWD